jgi:hypothetical protein
MDKTEVPVVIKYLQKGMATKEIHEDIIKTL